MNRSFYYFFLILVIISCKKKEKALDKTAYSNNTPIAIEKPIKQTDYKILFQNNPEYISTCFDFPVGKPNAMGYYNAQKFKKNNHLGDDWNGVGGGNSDLGDAIYTVSNGYVVEAKDYKGGWGNVVRINHLYKDKLYQSVYAHCDTIIAVEKTFVKRGDKIATIGNCNGTYYAHLHLEIRDSIHLDIGAGYSDITDGYLDPTAFIKKN